MMIFPANGNSRGFGPSKWASESQKKRFEKEGFRWITPGRFSKNLWEFHPG
jgi:hypothetical protein